jgi:serine/threonine protein kinase
MSPEQATGERIDARVDVYSLGIVLYEMLTGRVPFESDSYMGVLTKQLYSEPMAPSRINPALAAQPELEDVVLRCLNKNPANRFASMSEMSAALETIAASWGERASSDRVLTEGASVRLPLASRILYRRRRYRRWAYVFFGILALGIALTLLYEHWVRTNAATFGEVAPVTDAEGRNALPVVEPGTTPMRTTQKRVDAVSVRQRVAGPAVGSAPPSLLLEPGKNGSEKVKTGRSGGATAAIDSARRVGEPSVVAPNSNGEAKVGSSGISDPWAQ